MGRFQSDRSKQTKPAPVQPDQAAAAPPSAEPEKGAEGSDDVELGTDLVSLYLFYFIFGKNCVLTLVKF